MISVKNRISPYLLIFVISTILIFAIISLATEHPGAENHFLFDNIFMSQLVSVALLLFLAIRRKNRRLARRFGVTFIAGITLVVIGYSIGIDGPRIRTESDHPSSIVYLCEYYKDDISLVNGNETLCFIKNSVSAGSNPAWIFLEDYLMFSHRSSERYSQLVTFALFNMTLGGVFVATIKIKK